MIFPYFFFARDVTLTACLFQGSTLSLFLPPGSTPALWLIVSFHTVCAGSSASAVQPSDVGCSQWCGVMWSPGTCKAVPGCLEQAGCQPGPAPGMEVSAVQAGADGAPARAVTHPSGFALVLHRFFGVGHSPLHIVHRVLHIVLDAVNHFSLQKEDTAHAPARVQT